MPFVATLIALVIGGIADSGYLVYRHRLALRHQPTFCPLDHDCNVVTESKWSSVLGIRNDSLGLAFFVGMLAAVLAMLSFAGGPMARGILFWMSVAGGVGTAYSLFLVVVQLFIIKDYCFYCLISAGLTIIVFANCAYLLSFPT